DIDLCVKVANDSETDEEITVKAEIAEADGEASAKTEEFCSISAKEKTETRLKIKINDPILWNGTENPCLYSVKITLQKGETVLDEYTQTFGIRTYSIDPEKGFFLNGKYIDLHGVNYHQDSFESGWAMTNEQRERDYNMMLDMGCNTVRMAHYQHDGYEYDFCDRLGMTVWTEIGIVNKMSADNTENLKISPDFKENAKQQLTELIRQNYNHPSVIVWGISNELHQMSDEIFDIYNELNAFAKAEDRTRLITFADNQFWGHFLELPADVVGCNRYFGWYKEAGSADMFGAWLDNYHKEKQTRPVCVSEYGGGGAISQHKDNIDWENEIDPWGERHYENYQAALHETIWAQFSQRRYLWAKYVWCMFDFSSNGRQEGDTKGQNDKGLAARERVPKDSFYFYKSVWNDAPMLHITEKRFKNRPSLVPKIKIYSNAERVELFLNGNSVGIVERKSLDSNCSTVFVWENIIINANKENEIKAKACFSDGKILEDRALWFGI
ncbi:MAG: glycoside hydrolase family 2 protein, partial [Ruminiclostridium sp.]|nr:glycoside hydrolase family 2 protein [Ruminiclostridium sp.]